jgi:hypothetical protein
LVAKQTFLPSTTAHQFTDKQENMHATLCNSISVTGHG